MIFFVRFVVSGSAETYDRCDVKLDMKLCSSPTAETTRGVEMQCKKTPLCQKHFSIAHMDHSIYHFEIISDLLRTCCGPCVKSSKVHHLSKVSDINPTLMETTNFVFPVLGEKETSHMYGYRFIPLIQIPNVFYITVNRRNVMLELIIACLRMWPLVIMCAFMVIISGAICWFMETWSNEREFPRTLLSGWFEGKSFWITSD